MARDDNVFALRPGQGATRGDLPVPLDELAQTVGEIGCFLEEIGPLVGSGAGFGAARVAPVFLQMTVVEERLEELSGISVTTWPDVRWALHFCDARVRALAAIRASAEPSYGMQGSTRPPYAWEDRNPGFAAVGQALGDVRDLIVDRYLKTHPAC